MLRSERGAPDGIHIQNYEEGAIYDSGELGPSLTKVFLDEKIAESCEERVTGEVAPMADEKLMKGPSQTQAFAKAPDNKEAEEEDRPPRSTLLRGKKDRRNA